MSSTTPTLSLTLYDSSTDQAVTFATTRAVWGGPALTSNFYKIDTAIGNMQSDITALESTRGAIRVASSYISANYYEANAITDIAAYATNMSIILSVDTTTSGTVTLNINALGTKSVMKVNSVGTAINLTGSDLVKGRYYLFVYDGTRWLWVSANSADQIQIVGTAGNVVTVGSTNNLEGTITQSVLISGTINSATEKTTPVDADYVGFIDSAASNVLKKVSWANIKATLKTYLDTLYQTKATIPMLSAESPRVYISSDTWTKPAGLHHIIIETQGSGAGGGGAEGTTGNSAAGGGGGGGGYSKKKILAVSLGATETVTVGAGGAGGVAGNNNGTAGNISSFGAHVSCNGGIAGNGMAAGTTVAIANGGGGNSASGGDINIIGGSGQYGVRYDATNSIPGFAGSSQLGQPIRGGTATNADGLAGQAYGTGGSGGRTSNSNTDRAGGVGADGVVIVWEYVTG